MVLRAGQLVGALGAEQIGPGGRADDEGAAGEHAQLAVAVQEQEGQMLVGMPRRGQRAQRQPAQVGLVAIGERGMREAAVAGGGGQHRRAVIGCELQCPGEEVRMQVGVGDEGHGQAAPAGLRAERAQVPAHVHGQGPAVAEVDQVGAVAQPRIDQRDQVIVRETHRVLH